MAGGWGKVEACVSVSATTWLKKWQKEGTFFASLFSLSEKYIGKGWQNRRAVFQRSISEKAGNTEKLTLAFPAGSAEKLRQAFPTAQNSFREVYQYSVRSAKHPKWFQGQLY